MAVGAGGKPHEPRNIHHLRGDVLAVDRHRRGIDLVHHPDPDVARLAEDAVTVDVDRTVQSDLVTLFRLERCAQRSRPFGERIPHPPAGVLRRLVKDGEVADVELPRNRGELGRWGDADLDVAGNRLPDARHSRSDEADDEHEQNEKNHESTLHEEPRREAREI